LIFLYARRKGLQSADCDDVTQEVLAAVLKNISSFQYDPNKGRFRGWLQVITQRAVFRKIRPGADALARAVQPDAHEPEQPSARDDAWETEWQQYHVRTASERARFEFSSRDFEAFEAMTIDGESASDVANRLGISADAVYKAKSRILLRIREHVAEQVSEEG
jgi:RNA polymerase sigma-70 factor (ECF subfamily)